MTKGMYMGITAMGALALLLVSWRALAPKADQADKTTCHESIAECANRVAETKCGGPGTFIILSELDETKDPPTFKFGCIKADTTQTDPI